MRVGEMPVVFTNGQPGFVATCIFQATGCACGSGGSAATSDDGGGGEGCGAAAGDSGGGGENDRCGDLQRFRFAPRVV